MSSDDTNTLKFAMTPLTQSYFPNVADGNFVNRIKTALTSGDNLQKYVDSLNASADFWDWIGQQPVDDPNHPYSVFVDGTTPAGDPIMFVTNSNVALRYGGFYTDPATVNASAVSDDDQEPQVVGLFSVELKNTTSTLSNKMSFVISAVGAPISMKLTRDLFTAALKPMYRNAKTWIMSNINNIRGRSARGEETDALLAGEEAAAAATEETEAASEELIAEGVEYVAIDWAKGALSVAGIGVLAALPLIAKFIAHPMNLTLQIINNSDFDFTWDIAHMDSGKKNEYPGDKDSGDDDACTLIPKRAIYTDPWGDTSNVPTAYEADFAFINSSDYGSIGLLMTLTPNGANEVANLVMSIPWAGENTIWLGTSNDDAETTYDKYCVPNGKTTMTHDFDGYTITTTITKLSGKTNDQYTYTVMAYIEMK